MWDLTLDENMLYSSLLSSKIFEIKERDAL